MLMAPGNARKVTFTSKGKQNCQLNELSVHIKRMGYSLYLFGTSLVAFRVFCVKRYTAGGFGVPFKVLRQKKIDRTGDSVLF